MTGHSLKLAQEISQTEFRELDALPYKPAQVVEHPRVLYINTSTCRYDIVNEAMGLWPGAQAWSIKRDRYLLDNPAKHDELYLYHVPSGDFIEHYPQIMSEWRAKRIGTVIVNSVEFACSTARHRDDLVFKLVKLRDEGCTVIVFSQEPKQKVLRRTCGPMSTLMMQADAVLDSGIFEPLVYAEPVGSTHEDEESYYASTGECGPAYFKHVRELCGYPDPVDESKEEEVEEEVPPEPIAEGKLLASSEIEDNIRDEIDLPQELVDGGVYSLDGELVCVNSGAPPQTLNSYRVHRNSYESAAHASASARDEGGGVGVVIDRSLLDATNPIPTFPF